MKNDELEQQLWELEYGLLSEEAAESLRAEIDSNPELAAAYKRVRNNSQLVAQAAKIDEPRIKLRIPESEKTNSPFSTKPDPASSARYSTRIRRAATWCLTIASMLLLATLGWSARPATDRFADHSNKTVAWNDQPIDQKEVLITVDAPAKLSREAKNPVSVSTTTAEGNPQSVELKMRLEGKDGRSYFYSEFQTDERGRANLVLPNELPVDAYTLNVDYAPTAGFGRGLQANLAGKQEQEYLTYLTTDKPRYRPGETVRYRSLTLSRFGLKADRDTEVEFVVTDPEGKELAESKLSGTTQAGVGNGEFVLGDQSPRGQYTLIARHQQRLFPEARHDFAVAAPIPRQYDIAVDWFGNTFTPGSNAEGSLQVKSLDGQAAAGVKLAVRGYVDGRQLEQIPEVTTDFDGKAVVRFAVPDRVASGEGELGIEVENQEATWKKIPLRPDQLQVDFYPEGGDLVPNVENRVYFHAHDSAGRPVSMQGRIVDSNAQDVVAVATPSEGRGAFRFIPAANSAYSLKIEDPAAVQSQPPLPPASSQGQIVIDAGRGVFEADSSIDLKLRAVNPPNQLGVVAYCRGVTVGQISVTPGDFQQSICALSLALIPDAWGVVRLTVFDYTKQPAEPLAERLVFRKTARKLNLALDGLQPNYSAGAAVSCNVLAFDESRNPVATPLGISVLDDTVLQLAQRQPAKPATHFVLLGDVQRADQLEDANVFLREGEESEVALDLLLGTQGWRRFDRVPNSRLAGGSRSMADSMAFRTGGVDQLYAIPEADKAEAAQRLLDLGSTSLQEAIDDAPRRFDNRESLELSKRRSEVTAILGKQVSAPAPRDRRFEIFAACGLAVLVFVFAAIRWRPTVRMFWGGMTAAAVSLIVLLLVGWTSSTGRPLASSTRNASESARTAAPPTASKEVGEMERMERIVERHRSVRDNREPASAAVLDAESASPLPAAEPTAEPRGAEPVSPTPAPAPAAPAVADPSSAQPAPETAAAAPNAAAPVPPAPAPANAPAVPSPAGSVPAGGAGMGMGGAVLRGGAKPPAPKAAAEHPLEDRIAIDARAELERRTLQLEKQLSKSEDDHLSRMKELKALHEKVNEPAKRTTEKLDRAKLESEKPNSAKPNSASGEGAKDRAGARGDVESLRAKTEETAAKPGDSPSEESLSTYFTVRQYAFGASRDKKQAGRADDYAESIYWHPLLFTDQQGKARIDFGLPDTRTRYRILVDGHIDGRLGSVDQIFSTE